MKSLLLDRSKWDLVLDAFGNIAVASDPYAAAQDVACAVRLFKGELWYDTTKGVPHFQEILGHQPPIGVLKAEINAAAKTVPGIQDARTFIGSISGREVIGQVQVTTDAGRTVAVSGNLQGAVTPL